MGAARSALSIRLVTAPSMARALPRMATLSTEASNAISCPPRMASGAQAATTLRTWQTKSMVSSRRQTALAKPCGHQHLLDQQPHAVDVSQQVALRRILVWHSVHAGLQDGDGCPVARERHLPGTAVAASPDLPAGVKASFTRCDKGHQLDRHACLRQALVE